MCRRLCLLIVPFLLTALLPDSTQGQSAGDKNAGLASLMKTAQDLYDRGKHEDARKTLTQLRKLAPSYPGATALGKRVDTAIERKRLSLYQAAAFADQDRAAKNASGGPTDEKDLAISAAKKMLAGTQPRSESPRDAKRLYEHAEAMVEKGRYDAARRILAEIGPDDEEFDRARTLRARIDAWEAKSLTPTRGKTKEIDRYLKKRLDKDLATARQLFNGGKWRETVDACDKMRRYAPEDARVRRLLLDARIELTDVRVRDIHAETERTTREMLGQIETTSTPFLPKVRLTRPKFEPDVRIRTPDEIALERKLNERVSIDLIDAPLSYVLDLLARSVGINIIIDPAAVQDKTVTINVQNTTLQEVLDFITRNAGVSFTRGRNTVYVTTPEQPMLSLRIFHLSKGLTDATHDITPKAAAQKTAKGQPPKAAPTGARPSQTSDIELLLDEIESGLIDWPTGSRYYLDRKRNVLFLRSTPETLDTVERMIKALDENPVQVLVTTRFIEVDAESFDDVGVNWNLTNNYPLSKTGGADKLVVDAATGTTFDPRVASEAGDAVSSADGLTFGVTGILTRLQFQATLKAIQSRYKGRVVNAPAVIAMNNVPAKFMQSEDLWYVADYRIDRTDLTGAMDVATSEPVIVPEFRRDASIGFSLTVTPSVGRDSRDITLLLEAIFRRKSLDSLSSPVILPGGLEPINIERPIVIDRRMWVKVTIRDGYHVVLGGMVTSTKREIEAKVPILGDIPVLGWLFRRKTTRYVRTNLLVFVSARILDPRGYRYKTEDEEKLERLSTADLTRSKAEGGVGVPAGIGVESAWTSETREILGPRTIVPRDGNVTDLKEIGVK